MRKAVVLVIAVTLLAGASVGAASAKETPPLKSFEASGSFLVGDPIEAWVIDGRTGVTARHFTASCAIPLSQGFDGFVVELPDEIAGVPFRGRVTPSTYTPYGLSMTSYNAKCKLTGLYGDKATFATGTKYILVTGWLSTLVAFNFTAIEIR